MAAAPASPLLPILDAGEAAHQLVCSPDRRVFTGFSDFRVLVNSSCVFRPMNSNRVINAEVVKMRAEANENHFRSAGQFCEFGQINLLVISSDPTLTFHVMDGQHRCAVMQRLLHLNQPIWFQLRAKVVPDEAAAYQELQHFQDAYPSDPRSFFPTQRETQVATECLALLRQRFPSPDLFKSITMHARAGARIGDPDRPHLTDHLVFGLLQEAGLAATLPSAAEVLDQLVAMNTVMAGLARRPAQVGSDLGAGVTARMLDRAAAMGCFLGLFRPGKLAWADLAPRLPPRPPPPPAPTPPAPGPARPDAGDALTCSVCLERRCNRVFFPCGHTACDVCAPLLQACCLCRAAIQAVNPLFAG